MTQLAELKKHLRRNRKGITQLEAFNTLGVCRLSERIRELEGMGWQIDRKPEMTTNRYGNTTRVVRYRMIKGA